MTIGDFADPLSAALWLARRGWYVHPLDHPSLPVCAGVRTKITIQFGAPPGEAPRSASLVPGGDYRRGAGPPVVLRRAEEHRRCLWALGSPRGRRGRRGGTVRYAASSARPSPTFTVRTGKGLHYYFEPPAGVALGNREGSFTTFQIDVRGQGGYVVGPGSLHAGGARYEPDRSQRSCGRPPTGWSMRSPQVPRQVRTEDRVPTSGPIPTDGATSLCSATPVVCASPA